MAELITLAHRNRDHDALAIGDLYQRARSSAVDSLRCLIEAGQRLTAKKKSLRHGEWLPWLQDNADLLGFETPLTAQRLMKVAAKCVASDAFDLAAAVRISRLTWGHAHNDGLRGMRGTGEHEWFTPVEYIEAARQVLGEIDLDPASHPLAQETILATQFFTRERCGLEQEWHGRVWLNPPYGRDEIWRFVDKLIAEIGCGHTTAAIMLTHNYTDTEWFQRAVPEMTALCFMQGRIKFVDDNGNPANPTQGQTFFYYGQNVRAFHRVFRRFGFIVTPR